MRIVQEPVSVEAVCKKETEKAILVTLGDGEEVWVPKSQIDPSSEVQGEGDDGALLVSQWFGREKGWD